MEALASMQSFLRGRPTKFKSMEQAIEWCVRSGQVNNSQCYLQLHFDFLFKIKCSKTMFDIIIILNLNEISCHIWSTQKLLLLLLLMTFIFNVLLSQ